jgi:C4-dicarboxylate transporter DctQ subunit
MKFIDAFDNALAWVERSIIVLFLTVMTVLAFTQVVLRNAFSFGFLWADSLLRYMVMWVGFLGATLATRQEKHFGIDFLNRFLPPRALHIVKSIIDLFAAVVAFLIMRASFQFLVEAIGPNEADILGIPKRIDFAILPIGFGLIAIHFLLHVVRHVRGAIVNEPSLTEPIPPQTVI